MKSYNVYTIASGFMYEDTKDSDCWIDETKDGYWIKSEDFDRYKQLIRQGYERMKDEIEQLQRENEKLKEYAMHNQDCICSIEHYNPNTAEYEYPHLNECDCGLKDN